MINDVKGPSKIRASPIGEPYFKEKTIGARSTDSRHRCQMKKNNKYGMLF